MVGGNDETGYSVWRWRSGCSLWYPNDTLQHGGRPQMPGQPRGGAMERVHTSINPVSGHLMISRTSRQPSWACRSCACDASRAGDRSTNPGDVRLCRSPTGFGEAVCLQHVLRGAASALTWGWPQMVGPDPEFPKEHDGDHPLLIGDWS